MEMLQGVWKQHLRPRAVVGYGVKIFLPSPPNYVTKSPGCVVHERFSSTYTLRDLAWDTCLIGVPLIVKFGADCKVHNLCLDPMSINSVFE